MSAYDQTPYFHRKCIEKGLPFPPPANVLNQIDQSRILVFEKNLLAENGTDREVSEAFLDSLVAQYELTYQQRGKRKPTKQSSEGFKVPNKTSKAVHYQSEPIKVNNQFEVLNSVEQMETNVNNADLATTPKIKKPPPVIVQYNKDFEQLLSLLKAELHSDTTAEYLPNGQLKIKSTTNEERNNIMKIFQDHNIGYYTYGGQETDNIKFVMKGLPPSFSQENIVNALADKQITLLNIRQLKRSFYDNETQTKQISLLPIWVLTIPRTPESTEKLKSLTGIHHIKITIEPYKGNNSSLLQCFRCQGLGHKAQLCTLTPKCVKCGQKHNTKDCNKLPETPATCANCGGEHPANYRNCPRIMQYKKRQESRTMSQNLPQSIQMSSFPKLRPTTSTIPGFQRVESSTSPPQDNEFEDIKSIFTFFKTDKFKQVITSFKTLITDIKSQPDKMSKAFTLCSGIVDIIANIFK